MRLALYFGIALALCWTPVGTAAAREVLVVADHACLRDLLPAAAVEEPTEAALDLPVVTDLMPGERRALTPAELVARLAQAGVDAGARGWRFSETITITRRCQIVSADDLVRAGEEAIRRELDLLPGDEATIVLLRKPRSLLAPVGELSLHPSVGPPKLRGGLWVVTLAVRVEGIQAISSVFRYRVTVIGDVLVTTRPLRRHDALDASHARAVRREVTAARGVPLRDPSELPGRRATRAVAAGTIVTTAWTEGKPAVCRGDLVVVCVHVGPVVVCARVEALADGDRGEQISVRATDGRRECLALVTGPGKLEVIVEP